MEFIFRFDFNHFKFNFIGRIYLFIVLLFKAFIFKKESRKGLNFMLVV